MNLYINKEIPAYLTLYRVTPWNVKLPTVNFADFNAFSQALAAQVGTPAVKYSNFKRSDWHADSLDKAFWGRFWLLV
ncbi:MAG TPA: hypothetical protein DCF63_04760, partial [Planctomycetaceae bacterium]|nr:hypothetical protein [Planctomycetaceae bacterium]